MNTPNINFPQFSRRHPISMSPCNFRMGCPQAPPPLATCPMKDKIGKRSPPSNWLVTLSPIGGHVVSFEIHRLSFMAKPTTPSINHIHIPVIYVQVTIFSNSSICNSFSFFLQHDLICFNMYYGSDKWPDDERQAPRRCNQSSRQTMGELLACVSAVGGSHPRRG